MSGYTQLEAVEHAHIACRAAWLYPGDDEARQLAVGTCAQIGFKYIELVASTMEHFVDQHEREITPDDARLRVAESFRMLAMRLVADGQGPRANATAPGNEQQDADDYGSLA